MARTRQAASNSEGRSYPGRPKAILSHPADPTRSRKRASAPDRRRFQILPSQPKQRATLTRQVWTDAARMPWGLALRSQAATNRPPDRGGGRPSSPRSILHTPSSPDLIRGSSSPAIEAPQAWIPGSGLAMREEKGLWIGRVITPVSQLAFSSKADSFG